MRAKQDCQLPLTINLGEHDHVDELREISGVLERIRGSAQLSTRT